MKKNKIPAEKLMFITGALVLIIATIMNLTTKYDFISIIPYTKYVEATINSICSIICIILIFKPKWKILEYLMFGIEATITSLIGFIGIGCMLLMFLGLSLFTDGAFKKNYKQKLTFISIWWALVIAGVFPAFGIKGSAFAIAVTFFYVAIFLVTYAKLQDKLSYLLPKFEVASEKIQLPYYGSKLYLKDYGLTERQIDFLRYCIIEGKTYEEIAAIKEISVSVVKKEMSNCCKLFGVKNRESLRILLLQYKIDF